MKKITIRDSKYSDGDLDVVIEMNAQQTKVITLTPGDLSNLQDAITEYQMYGVEDEADWGVNYAIEMQERERTAAITDVLDLVGNDDDDSDDRGSMNVPFGPTS